MTQSAHTHTMPSTRVERVETIVIGGGQAGLAVGHHLAARDVDFVILDAERRTGDVWRRRWDSLRLFTPAAFSGLPGMRLPRPADPSARQGRGGRLSSSATPNASISPFARHAGRVTRLGR